MPPKKKRGGARRGGPGRGKRGKMGSDGVPEATTSSTIVEPLVESIEIETTVQLDESSTSTPPYSSEMAAAQAAQVRNHKNFGKFRYLHDNSSNSAAKSGESEPDEIVFIVEEADDKPLSPAIVDLDEYADTETTYIETPDNVNEVEIQDVIVFEHSEIETVDENLVQYEVSDSNVDGEAMLTEETIILEHDSQKSSETVFELETYDTGVLQECIVEEENGELLQEYRKIQNIESEECIEPPLPEEALAYEHVEAIVVSDQFTTDMGDELAADNSEDVFYKDLDVDNLCDSNINSEINTQNAQIYSKNITDNTLEELVLVDEVKNNEYATTNNREIEENFEIKDNTEEMIPLAIPVADETRVLSEKQENFDVMDQIKSDIVEKMDTCAPDDSFDENTEQHLTVIIPKDDLVESAVNKLHQIKLDDADSSSDEKIMETIANDEEETVSTMQLLKKKGRPRKPKEVVEKVKKPPRKSKSSEKKADKKVLSTPEKTAAIEAAIETVIETVVEQDDGASAFVKALELADKAAQKKIAKQKEAKAKKFSAKLAKSSGKKPAQTTEKTDEDDENNIRRSSRIKTITSMRKTSRGKGLVKSRSFQDIDTSDNSNSAFTDSEKTSANVSMESPTFSSTALTEGASDPPLKPVKVKSRWRRSSELEMIHNAPSSSASSPTLSRSNSVGGADSGISLAPSPVSSSDGGAPPPPEQEEAENRQVVQRRLKQFVHLKENKYLTERISCKEARKMTCDCFLTEGETDRGEFGCGEDCLNRLLMIECGPLCAVGDRCTNKRFQKGQFAPCEAFNTVKKGLGIRAAANIPYGEFILEYVGEVLDPDKFDKRAAEYSQDKNRHYYFMALRADAIIDATQKGNISRFINHSCDPNAETQKWTVNGELRIGFFSKRTILAGEEITFDYQFQRYGKEAQKCFCEAATCRGWLGEEPEDEEEYEDDEEEDEEEEEGLEDKQPDSKKTDTKEPEISDESPKKEIKKKSPKKERIKRIPRKQFFEDLDLDAEIETLQTTGLKNQAHTLKLSRLMVRSKEPAQRTNLLRLLRRGEFPCRRLFLDYHGLRLIHGWMTDAQQLAKQDRKMESLRLEILQTIATLPIPNKTMLKDSKVLSTVEKWSIADKTEGNTSPADSESNSPKEEEDKLVKIEVDNKEKVEVSDTKTLIADLESPIYDDQIPGKIKAEDIKTQDKMDTDQVEVKLADIKVETNTEIVKDEDVAEEMIEQHTEEVFTIIDEDEDEDEDEIRRSVGMNDRVTVVTNDTDVRNRSLVEELTNLFSDDEDMDISPNTSFDKNKETTKAEENLIEPTVSTESPDLQSTAPEPTPTPTPAPTLPTTTPTAAVVSLPPPPESPDYLTEIVALALKLLEEWAGLKEVFRIPKRERIEQMKEHEREANKQLAALAHKGAQGDGGEGGSGGGGGGVERRMDSRYRHLQGKVGYHIVSGGGYKGGDKDGDRSRKGTDDRYERTAYPSNTSQPPSASRSISKHERRKQFTLRLEQEESERRRRQRELWRQHEQHCLLMGTDPRFTAPYDPARGAGYHCIWNPATGQWQNYTTAAAVVGGGGGGVYGVVAQQQVQQQQLVLPALPYQDKVQEMEEAAKVKFMGPIPPPAQLPPKWKCAKDKYGRPYYYHIRIRKAQWEPPPLNIEPPAAEESSSTTSSSDTSSLSSSSSEEESESDDECSDTKLLIEIRNKFNRMDAQKRMEQEKQLRLEALKAEKLAQSKILADVKKAEPSTPPTPINTEEDSLDETMLAESVPVDEVKVETNVPVEDSNWEKEGDDASTEVVPEPSTSEISSLDKRLKDELGFLKDDSEESPSKKKRAGLVKEYIISPRSDKDKIQFREDLKKYKENKEILRKQKELIIEQSKKRKSSSSAKLKLAKHSRKKTVKLKLKQITDINSETAKKIKETFRSAMATVMVSILNSYRKPECQNGRITNTEDFKHLARKLTHFVMLKELKHCKSIEDLICTDSVKSKAKEFVRKYMSKFGEVYVKPKDDIETYL